MSMIRHSWRYYLGASNDDGKIPRFIRDAADLAFGIDAGRNDDFSSAFAGRIGNRWYIFDCHYGDAHDRIDVYERRYLSSDQIYDRILAKRRFKRGMEMKELRIYRLKSGSTTMKLLRR